MNSVLHFILLQSLVFSVDFAICTWSSSITSGMETTLNQHIRKRSNIRIYFIRQSGIGLRLRKQEDSATQESIILLSSLSNWFGIDKISFISFSYTSILYFIFQIQFIFKISKPFQYIVQKVGDLQFWKHTRI